MIAKREQEEQEEANVISLANNEKGVKAEESASGGGTLVEIAVRRSEFRISVQPHTLK